MTFKVSTSTHYYCSLERAFKTGFLCDLTKVHTGYSLSPPVTHTKDDENWGKVRSSKKVFVAKSLTQGGGYAFTDHVIERQENAYWKIQIDDFQSWMAGFSKFVGEWKTTQVEDGKILVEYDYTLHADKPQYYILNWLFAKLFWKTYMKKVLSNIEVMISNNEPYLYD